MDEVRDERETGFYQIDNEIIDEYAARIGVHALAVYNALARYSNKGRCFPSLSKLQKVLGVSRPTVVKAIETLKEHKLIRTEQRSTGEAGHEVRQSTVYTLLRVKTGAHQVEGGSKGDLLPLVNDVDHGSKGDLPGVVNDVYSNKTKGNKTNLTSGGDTRDRQNAAAAISQTEKDLMAAGGLNLKQARTAVKLQEFTPELIGRIKVWADKIRAAGKSPGAILCGYTDAGLLPDDLPAAKRPTDDFRVYRPDGSIDTDATNRRLRDNPGLMLARA